MPTPLTATTELATGRLDSDPHLLMTIEFKSPAGVTLRFSDQPFTSLLGQEWEPYVQSWGALAAILNTMDVGGQPATFTVTFLNTKPIAGWSCLSDLIRTPGNPTGYEWAFAKVTIEEVLSPAHGVGDQVVRGVFYIEDPTEIGDELLTVRMADQALVIEDQLKLLTISRDDFANADFDAVGKTLGVPFGVLKGVPCHAIVAGAKTTLTVEHAIGATTLTVSDTTGFPTSGTVQIDGEQKTYTGKTATTLTGGGALTAVHALGASVFEVRTGAQAYRFAPGINILGGVKAITAVYTKSVRTVAPTITLADTAIKPGFSLPTIDFAGIPFLTPFGVVDTIAVTSNSTTNIIRNSTTQPVQGTVSFPVGGGSNSANLPVLAMPALPVGTVIINVVATITYTILAAPGVNTYTIRRTGFGGPVIETGGIPQLGTRTFTFNLATSYGAQTINITAGGPSGGGSMTVRVDNYELAVEAQINIIKTGTVTLTGTSAADVLFGEVTCDLEGIQDDASGTITGTPATLLTNPTDITAAIMTQLYPDIALSSFGASRLTTRAAHAADAYAWAFLLEQHQFSRLRKKLGEQARAILYLEGGVWQYVYLADTPVASATIDFLRDIDRAGTLKRTLRADVKNSLTIYAGRDYTKTGDRGEMYTIADPHEDLTQGVPRRAGATQDDRLSDVIELDFVQDAATAAKIGAFELGQRKRQRFVIEELVTFWNALAVMTSDYLAIANHPRLAAHGGSAIVFRVTGRKDLSDGRIALSLREAA